MPPRGLCETQTSHRGERRGKRVTPLDTDTKCNFDRRDQLCWEHSGRRVNNQACSKKRKADRLEKKIAKLDAKRDVMRTFWKQKLVHY